MTILAALWAGGCLGFLIGWCLRSLWHAPDDRCAFAEACGRRIA